MALGGSALVFDILARDNASPAFRRIGDSAVLAATKAGRATTAIERSAVRMGAYGKTLTKSLTLPIVAGAAVAVDQAAKYQKGLNTIATATDQTSKQMASSSKGLLSIAKSTGTSLDQLTDSLYVVEKGGLRGAKALDTVRAAAQGAKAEGADLGTATTALTSIMASYGKSLGSPVQAENALIRGAGLAKTSYQDFASSLSNVVPLAAALHVSFAQVAGAIDTMTQHGESAQRSSENLNNLMRNLGGSNNVAVAAMGQLGLKSQDVAKTLSKQGPGGGLSGALGMVEKAMTGQSHGGMIVVSAFKNAQNATADLGTELAHMPPHLQAISKQFDSGKMSFKDYQTAVKGLGGQQYQLGKGFIATEAQAKGFSNVLKSGNPQVQTTAQAFQKLLGGATGMNAALMLSGNSAKTFGSDADQVAIAANKAGVNVLGWGKTQQTLSVKMDKAKENLQVLAVEVGTALIPALSKLATEGTKAIGWVDGLSHTQKEVLGWSVGVIAAVGPVLSIGSRLATVGVGIGKFTTGTGNAFARLTTDASGMSLGVSRAMTGVSSALAGAGIGAAVGTLTRNSSNGVKAIGALGSAAAGAAVGFGVGGPLGAAVGGLAGGLTSLATSFLGAGHSAKQAVKPTDDYTNAILNDKDAVGGATSVLVAHKLQQQGLYNTGLKLGIGQRLLTKAALGNAGAMKQVQQIQNKASIGINGAILNGQKLTKTQQAQADANKKLSDGLGTLNKTLAVNKQAANNITAGLGQQKKATTAASDAVQGLHDQTSKPLKLSADNRDAVSKIKFTQAQGSALLAYINSHQSRININAAAALSGISSVRSDLDKLRDKTININTYVRRTVLPYEQGPHGTGGSDAGQAVTRTHRAKGGVNLAGPGTGTSDSIPAMLSRGESVETASATKRNAVAFNAANHGATLAIAHYSKGGVGVGGDAGLIASALKSAFDLSKNQIAGFLGNFKVESGFNSKAYNARENAHGYAQWEGGRWTALQKTAEKMGVSATSSKAEIAYMLKELRGSDVISHVKKLKSAGAVAAYVDANYERSAGTTRQARINAANKIAKTGVADGGGGDSGSGAGGGGGGGGGGGITTTTVQGKKKWVYKGIKYASLTAAQNAQTRDQKATYTVGGQHFDTLGQATRSVNKALAQMPRALHGLAKAAQGSGSDVRSAFKTLITDAKAAGLTLKQRQRLTKMDDRLATIANARTANKARLSNLKQAAASEKSSIAGAVRGGFDITTAGASPTGAPGIALGSILAQARQADSTTLKFAAGLKKLRSEGLGLSTVTQLAQAGPSAYPEVQALLKATPRQIKMLNTSESSIAATGANLGGTLANAQFGSRIDTAKTLETKQLRAIHEELKLLRATIAADRDRPVQVTVDIDGKKTQTHLVKAQQQNARRK